MTMAKAVGIDLGTTNSVIAIYEGGQPRVIPSGGPTPGAGGRGRRPADEGGDEVIDAEFRPQ
jgi:hypothetical protein